MPRSSQRKEIDLSWLPGLLEGIDASKTSANPYYGKTPGEVDYKIARDPSQVVQEPYTGGRDAGRRNADYLAQEGQATNASKRSLANAKELGTFNNSLAQAEEARKAMQIGKAFLEAQHNISGVPWTELAQQYGMDYGDAGRIAQSAYGSNLARGSVQGIPEAQLARTTASNSLLGEQAKSRYIPELSDLQGQISINDARARQGATSAPGYANAYGNDIFEKLRAQGIANQSNQTLDAKPGVRTSVPAIQDWMGGGQGQQLSPGYNVQGAHWGREQVVTPNDTVINGVTYKGKPTISTVEKEYPSSIAPILTPEQQQALLDKARASSVSPFRQPGSVGSGDIGYAKSTAMPYKNNSSSSMYGDRIAEASGIENQIKALQADTYQNAYMQPTVRNPEQVKVLLKKLEEVRRYLPRNYISTNSPSY